MPETNLHILVSRYKLLQIPLIFNLKERSFEKPEFSRKLIKHKKAKTFLKYERNVITFKKIKILFPKCIFLFESFSIYMLYNIVLDTNRILSVQRWYNSSTYVISILCKSFPVSWNTYQQLLMCCFCTISWERIP